MSIIHAQSTTFLGAGGEELVMTAGTDFGNGRGYRTDGVPIGTLVPLQFNGQNVIRIESGVSGTTFQVSLFQTTAGDLGSNFWTSMLFESSDGNWNGFESFAADSPQFIDNNGEARWNQLPNPGLLLAGTVYNILWK